MMKRTLACSLLTLVLVSSSQAEAPVVVTEPSFNFGFVPQASTLTHTFWVKSTASEEVRITRFVPGCGCTKSSLPDSTIAPGDSVRLDIIFASGRFRGAVTKKPYFYTNLADERVAMGINAQVVNDTTKWAPIRFRPLKLDVSQFTTRPRTKAKFFLDNLSETDYEISLIYDAGRSFEVELPRKIKAGERVEGIVTILDDAIETSFEQSFTIELNDGLKTRLSLPITRMFRPPGALGQR